MPYDLTDWRYLLPAGIVLLGHRLHFLSLSGTLSALLIGIIVVEAGWIVTGQLITFFLLGSVATKVKQKEKEEAMPYPEGEREERRRKEAKENGGKADITKAATSSSTTPSSSSSSSSTPVIKHGRDMYQVFATGAIPALICATRSLFPDMISASLSDNSTTASSSSSSFLSPLSHLLPTWYLIYLSYISCCCGDTLASEIGMLSKQTPIMLLQKKRVARGVDGGMTLLGTVASIVGGMIIGAYGGTIYEIYLGGICGGLGSFADSIMGMYMQSWQYVGNTTPAATATTNGASSTPKTSSLPTTTRWPEKQSKYKLKSSAASDSEFIDATSPAYSAPESLPLTAAKWKQLNNVVNVLSSLLTSVLAVVVQYFALHHSLDLLPVCALVCYLLCLTVTPSLKPMQAVVAGLLPVLIAPTFNVKVQFICTVALYAVYRFRR